MSGVSREDFIAFWQNGKDMKAVCFLTGLSYRAVAVRVQRYRKQGYKLKYFKPRKHGPVSRVE